MVILYFVIAAIVSTASAQGTCQACNCQLNNVESLSRLIQSTIASGKLAITIRLKSYQFTKVLFFLQTIDSCVTGVTYTRWGKTSCPNDTSVELVYSGRAGGTNYRSRGGSSESIYLPDNPDYPPEAIDITSSLAGTIRNVVQGVEYEVSYIVFPGPEIHCKTYITTTRHVPSVLFLPDLPPSWCWLKLCVHHLLGLKSIIWFSYDGHYIGQGILALTLLQNWFQGQAVTLIPHSFITLLPTAMASPVHCMKITACSHVWCAQGDAAHNPELNFH